MPAPSGHETRALLRAHLSAASSFGHLTRHCPVCHRLLRLALDSTPPAAEPAEHIEHIEHTEPAPRPTGPSQTAEPPASPPRQVDGEDTPTA